MAKSYDLSRVDDFVAAEPAERGYDVKVYEQDGNPHVVANFPTMAKAAEAVDTIAIALSTWPGWTRH